MDYRLDTPKEIADAFKVKLECGLQGGMLVTNPIPEEYSMDPDYINKNIDEAIAECERTRRPLASQRGIQPEGRLPAGGIPAVNPSSGMIPCGG